MRKLKDRELRNWSRVTQVVREAGIYPSHLAWLPCFYPPYCVLTLGKKTETKNIITGLSVTGENQEKLIIDEKEINNSSCGIEQSPCAYLSTPGKSQTELKSIEGLH